MDSPQSLQKGTQPFRNLDLKLVRVCQASALQNCKINTFVLY